MFDLTKNNLAEKAESGYEFELTLPGSGDKTGAFVTVRGGQSKVVQRFSRKKYTEIDQARTMATRKGKEYKMTLDEIEDLSVETAIVRIISWRGIGEDDVEIPFTPENADRILREHSWMREQIMEESDQLLNFQPE
jgi:hypothetical protein